MKNIIRLSLERNNLKPLDQIRCNDDYNNKNNRLIKGNLYTFEKYIDIDKDIPGNSLLKLKEIEGEYFQYRFFKNEI